MSPATEWDTLLADNPKVLWGVVADVVKAVKAHEAGAKRTGRRPGASVTSLDELYELLFPPAYTDKPFAAALDQIMQARGIPSQKSLAIQIGINQATISRLVSGHTPPTVEHLERIAAALKLQPSYFAEYRALKLGQIVTDSFLGDPHLSADSVRRLFMGAHA